MRKLLLLMCTLVLGILLSCSPKLQKNDASTLLPPSPSPLGEDVIGQAFKGQVKGFAPPTDVFANDIPIASISPDTISRKLEDLDEQGKPKPETVKISANYPLGIIYQDLGYWDASRKSWLFFKFPQKTVGGSKWIRNTAEVDVTIAGMPDGTNFFAFYACKRYTNIWRCGWATKDGPGNLWSMLTLFKVTNLFPNAPTELSTVQGPTTRQITLTPVGDSVAENSPIQISAFVESKQKDIIEEALTIAINDANGNAVANVELKGIDEQLCAENPGASVDTSDGTTENPPGYFCKRIYIGEAQPLPLGEYTLDVANAPASVQVKPGRVKITDSTFAVMSE